MPHVAVAAPGISYGRGMRPGVRIAQHRVFLTRIEIGRFYDHRFHFEAVAGFHLQKFRLAELVLCKGRDLVLVNGTHESTVCSVKSRLRRRVYIAPGIDKMRERLIKGSAVIAVSFR